MPHTAARHIVPWVLALFASLTLHSRNACGYRPFDGTDAEVAPTQRIELEVGPIGYLREGGADYLIAPALIANYGVVDGVELVAEGKYATRLGDTHREPRSQLIDSALSIKHVMRAGVLQNQSGLSIANEWSVLFPNTLSDQRVGGQLTTIFSKRWPAATLHINLVNELSRSTHYVAWFDPIVEGPVAWRVRPVAEFTAVREFGSAQFRRGLAGSALLGVIANVTDALTFDGALRIEKSTGVLVREIRLGFTCDL